MSVWHHLWTNKKLLENFKHAKQAQCYKNKLLHENRSTLTCYALSNFFRYFCPRRVLLSTIFVRMTSTLSLIYRVFQKELHKVCCVINFEPFCLRIAMFASKCAAETAVNQSIKNICLVVKWPEVAACQQWRHLHLKNKNVTFNCRKSLVS